MSSRSRVDGFTLIEVMMALGIMTVGAVGIMAMQSSSTRGNIEARQFTTAAQVNRVWLERLRQDALLWTTPSNRAPTQYLDTVPQGWFTPVPANFGLVPNESYAFDFYGEDTSTGSEMVYCTNASLQWVLQDNTIRADVRTWWHRRGDGVNEDLADLSEFTDCASGEGPAAITAALATLPRGLHSVQTTTLLRWNGQ